MPRRLRLIRLDPDRDERAAVRHLRFHPTRPVLAAVVGDPDHFRELCRYRLDTDAPVATPQPDETYEYVPLETGPDPVASDDLELVATSVLAFDGVPAVVVIDTWSQEQKEFCFTSGHESVTFPALAFSALGDHLYAATSDPEPGGKLVRAWNLEALFDDDAADAEEDHFRRPRDLPGDELPTALATDPAGKFVAVGTSAGRGLAVRRPPGGASVPAGGGPRRGADLAVRGGREAYPDRGGGRGRTGPRPDRGDGHALEGRLPGGDTEPGRPAGGPGGRGRGRSPCPT